MTTIDRGHATRPDQADWGEPRHKTVVWHDPMITTAAAAELSGLEFIRSIRDGRLPQPPIAALFGFTIRDVEPGYVVFECVADESVYNPIGVVHGGLVCTLADTVAACAVHTTLDAGRAYTSIDLNVCSAQILDGQEKLVATATSTCLIMDGAVPS